MDKFTPLERSRIMARVKSKDTSLEVRVRKIVWSLGFRYRVNYRELPGCPDLVFVSRKKVIFVNGCFWHQHEGCRKAIVPSSSKDYWQKKLQRTKERDKEHIVKLTDSGWQVLTIWECELRQHDMLVDKLSNFLCDMAN